MSITAVDHWADILIDAYADHTEVGASLVRLVRPHDAPDSLRAALGLSR